MTAIISRRLAALLVLGVLAGCPVSTPYYDYSREPDPRKLEYVIGVSDHLQITVWRNPELSTNAVVRPDGTVTMPLIGDIKAGGRTPTAVRDEVTARLKQYIKDDGAVVTVAVTQVNSYRFTVTGAVAHPGVFTSNDYVTVVEAIALAGGPTKFAKHGGVLLIRTDPQTGKVRKIPINYDDVRSQRKPEANLVIMAGDTIYVP